MPGESADGFRCSVDSYRFGCANLVRCTGSRQAFRRTERMIGADSIDHYMIQIFRSGRCHVRAPGRERQMLPGDVCLFDNARTLDTVNESFDLLAFVVPRSELAPYLDRPDDLHYHAVPRKTPAAALFRSHLQRLFEMASILDDDTAAGLLVPTVELLAAALNSGDSGVPSSRRAARTVLVSRVAHYVDAHLRDPDLDAGTTAGALDIAPAELQRLFERSGGFDAFLRERRILAASRMLRARRDRTDVSAIAAATGFSGARAFVQAWYEKFRALPGDAGPGQSPRSRDERHALRRAEWAIWLSEI